MNHMETAGAEGGGACPNCGRERRESFCAHCGQSDRDYARSLRSVAGELLRETFALDSRLWRTLVRLLFRPGSLTREFSDNRRASFVSPVRLYIFASLAFFLILSLVGDFSGFSRSMSAGNAEISIGQSDPTEESLATEDSLATEENLAAFREALPPEHQRKFDDILGRPEGDVGRQIITPFAGSGNAGLDGWFGRFMWHGAIDILHDPSVVPRRFVANMPAAMFCLVPFFGLVLAALFRRRKRFYVEHLVFAIHMQAFLFIVYALALLFPDAGPPGWVRAILVLIPYPYFVIALKRYYENGWIATVTKSIGVTTLYTLILLPAFVISVFVTG